MTEIARAVCSGSFFHATAAQKAQLLWASKIYDAGVEFHLADEQLTATSARELADSLQHPGIRAFSFGECPQLKGKSKQSRKAWLALFPARHSAEINAKRQLAVTVDDECATLSANFAGTDGRMKKLVPKNHGNWPLPEADGVVSVTCGFDSARGPKQDNTKPEKTNQNKRSRGPELWYTVPTGRGPNLTVPHQNVLTGNSKIRVLSDENEALVKWINRIRGDLGLKPIVKLQLDGQSELLQNPTQLHDRKVLQRMNQVANKKNLGLTGEDRAVGSNLTDVAWLLWNSPRHRELLMNNRATHAVVASKKTPPPAQQLILSLMLFEKNQNRHP